MHAYAVCLHHRHTIVHINDQSRQTITFTVHEAVTVCIRGNDFCDEALIERLLQFFNVYGFGRHRLRERDYPYGDRSILVMTNAEGFLPRVFHLDPISIRKVFIL